MNSFVEQRVKPSNETLSHTPACRICGQLDGHKIHFAREMMFGFGGSFRYLECVNCGCVQLLDAPQEMHRYYPAEYYSFDLEPAASSRRFFQQLLDRVRTRLIKRYQATGRGLLGAHLHRRKSGESKLTILRPLALKTSDSIMDVGCGSGALLDDLSKAGFKVLYGIDPYNQQDLFTRQGVKISKKNIFEVDRRFDVIMFHHSFEHICNPRETLIRVAQLLKRGGMCLIRIPVASSFAWEHFKTDWVQLDAPRHYFLHTMKSMEKLAAEVGLELIKTIYDSNSFQFWASEQYKRGIPLRDKRSLLESPSQHIFTSEELESYKVRADGLNRAGRGDQAAFFFKKRNVETC